jgi:hypothetical protein
MKELVEMFKEKPAAADVKAFCKVWPAVKQGLEMLKKFIKNPFIQRIIDMVIGAGDAAFKAFCHT